MKKQHRELFLIMIGLLLSVAVGCSNGETGGEIATEQAESFAVLQQEVSGLATAQAESLGTSQETIVSIATTQAGSFNLLQEAVATQTDLTGQVQKDVRMVATAVADQDMTTVPAKGVGLVWQQEGQEGDTPLDLVADQAYYFDDRNQFLTEWLQKGEVLFIWKQTTSTVPENSLDEVKGSFYHAATLFSENVSAAGEGEIKPVALQNVLFQTSTEGDPFAIVRGIPQEITEAKQLQQTTTLEGAFVEAGLADDINQIEHLIILLESQEVTVDGEPALILLVLEEKPPDPPDPGQPNCGPYCVQCYNGICQFVCWFCR